MELKDTEIGDIVNFTYKQPMTGRQTRHLAKVVEVRKLTHDEIIQIANRSKYRVGDSEFIRTETLVTCTLPGGKSRNFYAERSDNCVKPHMGTVMYAIKDIMKRITG